MPKLPTDADLGVVPADATGRIASVSNAGAAGEATAQLGANVVQFGSTILDVHDENAQAAADSAIWRGKVALDQKYRNDPDPATAPQRYNDELTNLVSQSAGGIIQPRIKTQFMDMANRYVVARGVEMIQNQSDTALTNQAVAKLSDDGDAGVTAFAHSTDPRDQFGIAQSYRAQVDAMVNSRELSATDGDALYKTWIHRATYANIANAGDPSEMIRRWNSFNGTEPDPNDPMPAEPTMASEPAPGSMASKVPSDVYDTMAAGIQTELNRAQAQIDHKQAVDDKIKQQATDAAITGYQQQIIAHAADPTQPDIDMVKVSQDPRLKGDKTALPSLIAFQRSLDKPPTDDTLDKATTAQLYRGFLNGTATTKDFQDAFAPPDNSPGKISKDNLDFLMNQAKGAGDDVQSQSTKALKSAFLETNDWHITHYALTGKPIALPAAHDASYRFMIDFQRVWDAKVKAGEDPRGLITPGDKDYFGSQANLSHYVKTDEQWDEEAQKAQDEANPPGPGFLSRVGTAVGAIGDFLTPNAPATGFSNPTAAVPAAPKVYRSAADLQGAINSGEMSLPDAQAYGLAHGILKPKGPVAVAPVAAAGPTVPSGE